MLTNRCYLHRLSKEDRLLQALLWLGILGWLVRGTLFMRRRDGSQFATVDIYAFVHIAITGVLFLLILMSPRLKILLKKLGKSSGGILLMYFFLCAISAVWSPLPEYSLYRAVEVIVQLLAVYIVFSYSHDFQSAERTALYICILTLILGTVGCPRSGGLLGRWGSNGSIASAAMIFCYCFGEFGGSGKRRRRSLLGFGFLALVALLLNRGSAGMIAATCGIATTAIISRRQRGLAILILGSLVFVLFLNTSIVYNLYFSGKDTQQITSFHGRMFLWESYATEFIKSPIYGHGFAVTARLSDHYTTNTHNSLFSVLLGTGVIGMAIVVFGVIRLMKELALPIRTQRPGAIGCAAAFLTCFINCMSITVIGEVWRPESLVFVCLLTLHLHYLVPSLVRKSDTAIGLADQCFHNGTYSLEISSRTRW